MAKDDSTPANDTPANDTPPAGNTPGAAKETASKEAKPEKRVVAFVAPGSRYGGVSVPGYGNLSRDRGASIPESEYNRLRKEYGLEAEGERKARLDREAKAKERADR